MEWPTTYQIDPLTRSGLYSSSAIEHEVLGKPNSSTQTAHLISRLKGTITNTSNEITGISEEVGEAARIGMAIEDSENSLETGTTITGFGAGIILSHAAIASNKPATDSITASFASTSVTFSTESSFTRSWGTIGSAVPTNTAGIIYDNNAGTEGYEAHGGVTTSGAYWNRFGSITEPAVSLEIRKPAFETVGLHQGLCVLACIQNPTSATWSGYRLSCIGVSGEILSSETFSANVSCNLAIEKIENGVVQILKTVGPVQVVEGQSFGLWPHEGEVMAWFNNGNEWVLVGSTKDSTWKSGYIGLGQLLRQEWFGHNFRSSYQLLTQEGKPGNFFSGKMVPRERKSGAAGRELWKQVGRCEMIL